MEIVYLSRTDLSQSKLPTSVDGTTVFDISLWSLHIPHFTPVIQQFEGKPLSQEKSGNCAPSSSLSGFEILVDRLERLVDDIVCDSLDVDSVDLAWILALEVPDDIFDVTSE